MKAAVLEGPKKLVIKDVPMPTIDKSEVLIKVHACGICGSDLPVFKLGPFRERQILGHEFTGTIVELGQGVKNWEIGHRVVVDPIIPCGECYWCKKHQYNICSVFAVTGVTTDGAYAEYVKVPAYQLYRIPDEVGFAEGTLFQPMSGAQHAVRISNMQLGDTVAVFGAGTIGLFAMLWAKALGAEKVIAVEVVERRIAVAKTIADVVLNPTKSNVVEEIQKLTDDIGPHAVIECSGNTQAQSQALDVVRKGGCVVLYGVSHEPTPVNFLSTTTREITIKGGLASQGAYPLSIQAVKSKKIDTSGIPIMKVGLNDIERGFEACLSGEEVKVVVIP
jgi:(R,R)-butanediol dehydrogenase/meso-butanediol dehydrogenase/diacetyl reductase